MARLDSIASAGLSLLALSHGGNAGIKKLESLGFWEVKIPFQNATSDSIASAGLSLSTPSHGGNAGIKKLESLGFWEVKIPFQNATPATLQGTAPRVFWLKPVGFLEGTAAVCLGLLMTGLLMRRHDEQLTNQTPMKLIQTDPTIQ